MNNIKKIKKENTRGDEKESFQERFKVAYICVKGQLAMEINFNLNQQIYD